MGRGIVISTKDIKGHLRAVYGGLLRIPVVGPSLRVPVRKWRERQERRWNAPDEVLSLLVAGLEGLRSEMGMTRMFAAERHELLSASVSALEGKLAETRQRLDGVTNRVEFARAELMFEMRANMSGASPVIPGQAQAAAPLQSKLIAKDKLAQMEREGQIRLNMGCGHVPLDGYINSDMRALPGVDLIADVSALPFESGTLCEIHSAHLLEHFPVEYLQRVLMPHWRSLLKPGGIFQAIVPDAEAMISDFHSQQLSFDDLREVTFGLQEYDGDFHFNMFSRASLKQILNESGFDQVEYKFTGRKNGKCRDMQVSAVRV
ncbi:hypothetical protein [Hyphomicrobium sp. CS1GBMeth3]|uniref:class I SAM-dependent methyltransferase n=1 Tax=Hyphomicrobium sp. CS1GBMeth3 TaxID=1892845 RepID=UPI00092FF11F|nr:hypothetical protein [Hyphomicrobium sp. CS1GBMeth3]